MLSDRKHFRQMAAPTRWIVATPISAHGGPVQDLLDPPAYPDGGRSYSVPHRLRHPKNKARIDRCHRQRADGGIYVSLHSGGELLPMLGVGPLSFVRFKILLRRIRERDALRVLQHLHRTFCFSIFDW